MDHILAVSLSPSPEKTESLNLFFCFRWVVLVLCVGAETDISFLIGNLRWILIAFKREFEFNEVIPLWEVLEVLFAQLALLTDLRRL